MRNYPRLSALTYLGFEINSAIDEGHGREFTFEEIYLGIETGTLLEILSEKLSDVVDLGLFPQGGEECTALFDVLRNAAEAVRGRERRKFGGARSGLSHLTAVIFEAIQQQNWTTPALYPLSPKEVGAYLVQREQVQLRSPPYQ